MECGACFGKPHARQYFSVPAKKNQLITLRHITPKVKVFHKSRHSAYGVLASDGRAAGFAVSIPVFDKSIYGDCFRLCNSKGSRKFEKLFCGNGIRMVIAGVLAGRIVFLQLICQAEKDSDIPLRQKKLSSERQKGLSISPKSR